MSADFDFWAFGGTDPFAHFSDLVLNAVGHRGDLRRHGTQGEAFLRVNSTVPSKLMIDVSEETPPNLHIGFGEDPRPKRQIRNVNILHWCGGFDFDDIPFAPADWIQNVGTAVSAVSRKRGLKKCGVHFGRQRLGVVGAPQQLWALQPLQDFDFEM